MEKNYFQILNDVNVNEHTESKNGLTYLSWAWAWAEIKKQYPDANYTIYENKDGFFYHTDGKTAWVKTGVSVCGIEHIEYLPVMDFRNKSIPIANITSFDVNKAIQRSLTKACARHGLGLYIYAGEDLPEEEKETPQQKAQATKQANKNKEQELKSRIPGALDFIAKMTQVEAQEGQKKFDYINSFIKEVLSFPALQEQGTQLVEALYKKQGDEIPY